jgi:hypothetical protein
MKKTRLLEIIREEISEALSEASYAGKGAIPQMKKDPKYSTLSGDGKVNAEKELKSGGTVELEEEDLNEIPDFGGRFDQQVAAKYGEDQTLEDATKDITDEILADMGVSRDALKKDADMAAAVLKAIRAKVVGKNQDSRVKKALEKQQEFDDSGNALQANQTNNAILKALGLKEPGQRGRKVDPNKPEKAPSTGKRGRPAGSTSAGKTAVLTPGDDGFDTVSYNEPEEDEAVAAMGGDETAKELGQAASVSKDENFDRIRTGLMRKARAAKGELSAEDARLANQIINTAKEKYKFNATQIDALRAVAGL